jgi:hypothetical protein
LIRGCQRTFCLQRISIDGELSMIVDEAGKVIGAITFGIAVERL